MTEMEKSNAREESARTVLADDQLVSYLFATQSYFCFNEEASMNKKHKCHSLSKYLSTLDLVQKKENKTRQDTAVQSLGIASSLSNSCYLKVRSPVRAGHLDYM